EALLGPIKVYHRQRLVHIYLQATPGRFLVVVAPLHQWTAAARALACRYLGRVGPERRAALGANPPLGDAPNGFLLRHVDKYRRVQLLAHLCELGLQRLRLWNRPREAVQDEARRG